MDTKKITWQEARRVADFLIEQQLAMFAESGIEPGDLSGKVGGVAAYADQKDFEQMRPEDQEAGFFPVESHRVILRAFKKEMRVRYNFRLVEVTIDAKAFFIWLGERENNAAERAEYVSEMIAFFNMEV